MDLQSNFLVMLVSAWGLPMVIGNVVVHLAFAAAIFADANRLKGMDFNDENFIKTGQSNLVMVGPFVWTIAVLVGGIFVAVAYWAIHHSSLRQKQQ